MSKKNRFTAHADAAASAVEDERLRVSFEYIDWDTEEFFFHGMETSYYIKFFETITELKKAKEKEITQQTYYALRPKSIFNTETSIKESFPATVRQKIADKLAVETRAQGVPEEQARTEALEKANEIISRAFEISLGTNYGRIHGYVWNNVFNVIWFDPAHNLYPMSFGVTPHSHAATVKCFSPEENLELQSRIKVLLDENSKLRTEYDELMQVFAETDIK